MASLAELRFGNATHPGHLSYENQYAASFNGFDPTAVPSSMQLPSSSSSGGNQLDFLFYADQLLNTFATTKNSNGDVVLSGKTRDLMEYLPHEAVDGLPGIPSSFSHSDFLPPAHSLPFNASQFMSSYGHPDTQQEDMWGLASTHHLSKASAAQHAPSAHQSVPYQGYSMHHRQQQSSTMLPAIVKQQEWRLCVKAPTLGTFYLFTDPEKSVGEMIPDIESKILELYHVFVSVHLLQNDHGIDLPFSCTISSVLEDRSLVCVQYMRAVDAAAGTTLGGYAQQQPYQHLLSSNPTTEEAVSSSARSPHSSPHSSHTHSPASVASPCSPVSSILSSPQSPYLHGNSSPQLSATGSAPTTPGSQNEGQPDTGVRFREPPPSKVLQNKEFSFTVSVKNMKNIFTAFNNPLVMAGQGNDADSGAYYSPGASATHNPWGAPVPMPMDDGEEEGGNNFSNFEIPIDVVVEEEGGGILHPRDYRIRCSVLDKQEGLYVFFVKLKKNSHYGRTRFIIKIRRKQPTKQERNLEYLETALLHNGTNKDGQLRLGSDQGARGDLLVSHPIVVISKERKTKRKRDKPDQN